MNKNTIVRSIIALSLFILLNNCGFSLRGSDVLSSKFPTLQLNSQQANSEFTRILRRSLRASEINIAPEIESFSTNPADFNPSLPVLSIANEQVVSRAVTVNPRARASQIEMRLSVDMMLTSDQEFLIPTETLFVERTYFEDVENISGNRGEIEIISTEMRRELINQLMRRLAAVDIQQSP
jgi:LPS-assembly lipoprotein